MDLRRRRSLEQTQGGDGRARMDALYLAVSAGLLTLSSIAWASDSAPILVGSVLLCLTATLALVVVEIHEIYSRKARIGPLVIVGGTAFWFLLDAAVLALGPGPFTSRYTLYPHFSSGIPLDVVGKTLFGVQLFMFVGVLAIRYAPIPLRAVTYLAGRRDRFSGWSMDLACFLVALLSYVPMMIAARGEPVLVVLRLIEMRNLEAIYSMNFEDPGLWHHLVLLGLFGGAVATGRFILSVKGNTAVRLLAMALTTMWVFLSGTRFQMVFLILPAMALLIKVVGGAHGVTHLRLKALVLFAIGAAAILAQAAIRNMGFNADGYDKASDFLKGGAVGYEHFEAMAIAIDLVDHREEFFHESLIPVLVTHFVPRTWWPEKPEWESWTFYNEAVTGGSGSFNVTPSVTGEYYLNWGIWGVVFAGLLFGWLAKCCDEWFQRVSLSTEFCSAVFCGFLFSFLFVSFRILSPIYIAFVVGASIVFWFLTMSPPRMTSVARGYKARF